MSPIVYAIPVFMVTIVIEAVIAWRKKQAIYDIPDALGSLHNGVLSRIAEALLRGATGVFYIVLWTKYRAFNLPAANPIVWIGAMLGYDMLYYWHHRFNHEVNLLWASHVVHHSSEYFNLSTALRQSSTGFVLGWMFYLPLALIGVPPSVFAVVALIDLLYQYWVHTELIRRMGWFDYVFVSPSNHRVHHGQNDYCIDKNYGGILIIWDRVFGTFADEREGEKIVYGIRKPLHSYNTLWANLHTYVALWRESVAAKGWRAKIGVWFAPPSGWTGAELPEFESTAFQRYDRKTPASIRWYAALQYSVTVVVVSHFMAVAATLGWPARAAYALVILATALSVGALTEGRAFARWIELARVIVLGAAFAMLPSWFGFAAPMVLKAFAIVLAALSAVWLLRASPTTAMEPAPQGALG